MKILEVAAYIYEESQFQFTNNRTGYGIVINDIAQCLAEHGDTEVNLLTHVITKEININGFQIMQHRWLDVITGIRFGDLCRGICYFFAYKQPLKKRARYLYYQLDRGYFERVLKLLHPDVVHIHGFTHSFHPYIEACKSLRIPYVITLHGLIGFYEGVKCEKHEKDEERRFLVANQYSRMPVTFISTGMKDRVVKEYGLTDSDNIHIVLNGTKYADHAMIDDIGAEGLRKKYSIHDGSKICIAIGSVCVQKNQIQLVRAIKLLQEEWDEKIYLFIIGTIDSSYPIQKAICENMLEDRVICCGFVDRDEIGKYYSVADLNILASIDEGFGLSIIEGFAYGIPAVTFSDIDASKDLFNESVMVMAKERTDGALAEALKTGLTKKWNRGAIVAHAKQYSLKTMAEEYLEIFKKAISTHV